MSVIAVFTSKMLLVNKFIELFLSKTSFTSLVRVPKLEPSPKFKFSEQIVWHTYKAVVHPDHFQLGSGSGFQPVYF